MTGRAVLYPHTHPVTECSDLPFDQTLSSGIDLSCYIVTYHAGRARSLQLVVHVTCCLLRCAAWGQCQLQQRVYDGTLDEAVQAYDSLLMNKQHPAAYPRCTCMCFDVSCLYDDVFLSHRRLLILPCVASNAQDKRVHPGKLLRVSQHQC